MKITKSKLRKIIREELQKENWGVADMNPKGPDFEEFHDIKRKQFNNEPLTPEEKGRLRHLELKYGIISKEGYEDTSNTSDATPQTKVNTTIDPLADTVPLAQLPRVTKKENPVSRRTPPTEKEFLPLSRTLEEPISKLGRKK